MVQCQFSFQRLCYTIYSNLSHLHVTQRPLWNLVSVPHHRSVLKLILIGVMRRLFQGMPWNCTHWFKALLYPAHSFPSLFTQLGQRTDLPWAVMSSGQERNSWWCTTQQYLCLWDDKGKGRCGIYTSAGKVEIISRVLFIASETAMPRGEHEGCHFCLHSLRTGGLVNRQVPTVSKATALSREWGVMATGVCPE